MAKADYYVYALERPDLDADFYIGRGKDKRCFQHVKHARAGRERNKLKLAIILKNNFNIRVRKIIENLTSDEANIIESTFIMEIGRYPHGPLANLTDGGEGAVGVRLTRERIEKMGAGRKGRPHSPEHNRKIGLSQKGKIISERTKALLRDREISSETRAKLSAAAKRRGIAHLLRPEMKRRAAAGRALAKAARKAASSPAASPEAQHELPLLLD